METQARYILIGAFTLGTAVLTVLFALWTAKHQADRAWNDYEILFTSAVTGLSVGSAVRFNGIPVGNVETMRIDPGNPGQVLVNIRVAADTPVKADTLVRLVPSGLTGMTFVQLTGGSPQSPWARDVTDQLPPRIHAGSSALERLLSFSEDIATQGHEVITRLLGILSPENAEQISEILASMNQFTSVFRDERAQITDIIETTQRSAQTLEGALGKLDQVLTNTDQVLTHLNQGIQSIDQQLTLNLPSIASNLQDASRRFSILLHRVDSIVADNEVALSTLGSDGLAQLGPTLSEIRLLVRDLQRLFARLEHNPTSFLLGREPIQEFRP